MIKQILSTPYHPSANGLVEKMVQIKSAFKIVGTTVQT